MDFRCHAEMLAVLRQARQGFQAPGRPCYDRRPLVARCDERPAGDAGVVQW
jgi:hypothetical protein